MSEKTEAAAGKQAEKLNEKTTAQDASSSVRPTKKQRELLTYIEKFIGEHGYSPSYREIMNGLQYTSVATVALHVNNLIRRGHLRKRDHSARSLEVAQSSASTAASEPPKVITNAVRASDEKWLIEKIERYFVDAEQAAVPLTEEFEQLHILVGALRVLGLEGAAQSFGPRLSNLKLRLSQAENNLVAG